ncbi:hypothetical protein BC361_32115 [Ensifer sp. LC54]|nr:hypothetical protein BC361_32115 [Ensifer sp. LC54]OCP18672.1 hypothetical protein BC363_31965 [Ensifer sp. LC384]
MLGQTHDRIQERHRDFSCDKFSIEIAVLSIAKTDTQSDSTTCSLAGCAMSNSTVTKHIMGFRFREAKYAFQR